MKPTRRRWIPVVLTLIAGALVAPATADTLARQEAALALFQRHAGEPVKRMPTFTLSDWRPLGKTHVAVFRGPVAAWLIQVQDGCHGLDWARTIGLTSTGGTVSARFDRVVFRDGIGPGARRETCRIEEIRPVDYRKVRADEKAARAAD
ncbi:MAG: DUF6491 family protein [Xanthomonadaceae bacterium]|jgi:hypothetical protein|nr:DUF6491 family protein [Xanthomonadaceae bacterium]